MTSHTPIFRPQRPDRGFFSRAGRDDALCTEDRKPAPRWKVFTLRILSVVVFLSFLPTHALSGNGGNGITIGGGPSQAVEPLEPNPCISEADLLEGSADSLFGEVFPIGRRPEPCSGRAQLILASLFPPLFFRGLGIMNKKFDYNERENFFVLVKGSFFYIQEYYFVTEMPLRALDFLERAIKYIGLEVPDRSFRREIYSGYVNHLSECVDQYPTMEDDVYSSVQLGKCIKREDYLRASCVVKIDLSGFDLEIISKSRAFRFCMEKRFD